jgi:hypothetical protein
MAREVEAPTMGSYGAGTTVPTKEGDTA